MADARPVQAAGAAATSPQATGRGFHDAPPSWPERFFWVIALSALFMVVYGGCNWITSQRKDVGTFFFEWERQIPFLPLFIVPYMTIDLFFVGSMFVCGTQRELRLLAKRITTAICIAGVFFLLFPLQLGVKKPEITGWTAPIFHFLWGFDQPYNLAPSLHIALRSILWFVYVAHTAGWVRRSVRMWFVLIGASTLFTWQHHVMDVVTGQLLALFCFYVFPDAAEETRVSWAALRATRAHYRLAAIYGGLALFSLVAAMLLRPWGWLLVWPALSLLLVAGSYWFGGPGVFRKSDGLIPWSARLVLAPYMLGSWLSFQRYRRHSEPFVRVAPGVYLGRHLNRREAEALVQCGVAAVLDLTPEFSQCRPLLNLRYKNEPILDLTAPTPEQLERCVAFTKSAAEQGGVYIHCTLGYSRSACVAAAHLLATDQAASPEEALEIVRQARPQVVLREDAVDALRAYQKMLSEVSYVGHAQRIKRTGE